MAGLFHSVKEIKGAVHSLGSKMGMNVQHLEDKTNEEWQQMRNGNQAFEIKMHKGFRSEEDERRTFHDELTSMKEEIKLIKMGSKATAM